MQFVEALAATKVQKKMAKASRFATFFKTIVYVQFSSISLK